MALKFFHKDRDLIADERLFAYYKNQWQILVERRMIQDYGGYLKKSIPNSEKIYYGFLYEYAVELESYYPASLITTVKPPKTKYQFNYN